MTDNFIDRKLFIPKAVHKVALKKGETLVWSLDFEQFKNLTSEQVYQLLKFTQDNLEKQFPKNKVIVTLGEVNLSTIQNQEGD